MNKVKAPTYQEDAVFERLTEPENPRGFFLEVVDMLEDGVDQLMRRAFRQEEYAVKYAIEPLLNRQGPLSELTVRLKLMLALGMFSLETYQDLELCIKLRDWLSDDIRNYRFSDEALFTRLKRLHCFQSLGIPELPTLAADDDKLLYQMQLDRQDQVIRSALLLSIATIVQELGKESPI